MNYIVFDLEWNQSPGGKKYSNSRLPFEIIEIGAVKMNEQREVVDVFQRLVKPQVYNWIHDSIHEVIHVDYKDLADGVLFPQAVEEFLDWCGEERVFCTWGNQDVMELQRNMKYYGLLKKIKGPVTYYDAQKIYGICYKEDPCRRSLEYAIDKMRLPKAQEVHRALMRSIRVRYLNVWICRWCLQIHPLMCIKIQRQEKKKFIYLIRIMTSMYHANLLRRRKS